MRPTGDLISLLVTALAATVWACRASGGFNWRVACCQAAVVAACYGWGRLLTGVMGRWAPRAAGFPWIFTVGALWTGLALGLARYALPFDLRSLSVAYAILAVAAVICAARVYPRSSHQLMRSQSAHATVLAILLTTLGMAYYFPPRVFEGGQLVFKPVRDYFVHANHVVLLAGGDSFQYSSRPGLAGSSPPFYHYGSYVFPALLTTWTSVPAYDALTGVWAPWGLLLVTFCGFIIGSQFIGQQVAVLCLLASATFPDLSYWNRGPLAGLFAYYYPWSVLRIAPANSFGIAAASVAVVVSLRGLRRGYTLAPLLAVAMAASGVWFKAQLMIPATLLCGLMAIFAIAKQGRSAILLSCLIAMAISLGVLGLQLENTPDIRLEWPPAEQLAAWLLSHTDLSTRAMSLFSHAAMGHGTAGFAARLGAIGLTTFGACGLMIAAAGAGSLLRGVWTRADVFFVASMMIYFCMALLIAPDKRPLPWGHPWDLLHIPAVWVYFVALNWAVGRLFQDWLRPLFPMRYMNVALAAMALTWNAWFGGCPVPDHQLTDQGWAHLRVPPAMSNIAEFVRSHTSPTAIVQVSDNDPYFIMEALGERRPYVGWSVVGSYTSASPIHAEFERRLAEHEALKRLHDAEAIRQGLEAARIEWYVVAPSARVAWSTLPFATPVVSQDGWTLLHIDHSVRDGRQACLDGAASRRS